MQNDGRTKSFNSWRGMKARCLNPNDPRFKDYGGRGITVCERWNVFANFLADMGERPEGTSLDRIDNTLGYSKENCRWAKPKDQQRNMRSNRMLTYAGKTQCMSAWAEELGLNRDVIRWHKRHGRSDREAMQWAIRSSLKAAA